MRRRVFVTLLLLLLPPSAGRLAAQVENQGPGRGVRAQPFYFDALCFAQWDAFGARPRLDLYVQVPTDIITFVKRDDGYVGRYTITAVINDDDGNRLKEDSWTRKVTRTSFEGTVDPNVFDLTQRSIALDPGKVVVEVIFEDQESAKVFRSSRSVEIRRFDPNLFSMSDIMLVSRVDEVDGKKQITPQINPNIASLTGGFSIFYELYDPFDMPAVRISYGIRKRNEVVMRQSALQDVHQGINTFITQVGLSAMSVGQYTLELRVTRAEDSTDAGLLAQASKQFVVEWLSGGTPISITDLNEAIEQLRYYAKQEDIDYINAATDEKEKRRRFENFWEKNNPVPGSSTNRAMIEYYTRVAYANEHFKHYIDGWRTDRGMVYIIYGPPSAVDRHPVEADSKPYEVWEYYDISRRFVFIDESGFGDYRLLYPIWDDRNRLR